MSFTKTAHARGVLTITPPLTRPIGTNLNAKATYKGVSHMRKDLCDGEAIRTFFGR